MIVKNMKGIVRLANKYQGNSLFVKMVLNNCTINKVDLHRKVYNLLDNEFSCGLHALELDLKSS